MSLAAAVIPPLMLTLTAYQTITNLDGNQYLANTTIAISLNGTQTVIGWLATSFNQELQAISPQISAPYGSSVLEAASESVPYHQLTTTLAYQFPISDIPLINDSSASSSASSVSSSYSIISSSISTGNTSRQGTASRWNGLDVVLSSNNSNDYAITSVYPFSLLNTTFPITNIYVDAIQGNDYGLFAGTYALPLKTINAAQTIVRSLLNDNPNQSIQILLNGKFYLNQTLNLTSADSPEQGNFVIFSSTNTLNPATVSGGYILPSNWTIYNNNLSIYSLYIGGNTQNFNNLYLNDQRIPKANNTGAPYANAVRTGGTTWNCQSCSLPIILTSSSLYTNGYSVELVMISNFQVGICHGIVAPSTNVITMDDFCASLLQNIANPLTLFYIVNGLPFLTQPNTWVYAPPYVYYIPASTTIDPNNLVFIVPNLETLIQTDLTANSGISNNQQISNIIFNNLIFSDVNWKQPLSKMGFFGQQGDWYLTPYFDIIAPQNTILQQSLNNMSLSHIPFIIPAAIRFLNITNSIIMRSTLRNMAASGISYNQYTTNNLFWNNEIYNIAASGICIGNLFNISYTVTNTIIQDNTIHDVALDYYGSSAISGLYATNTSINYNNMYNLPYSGIQFGQGFDNSPNFKTLYITQNMIYNVMNLLIDGGGIYVNAVQGMQISQNICHDVNTPYNLTLYGYYAGFCYYLDTGSRDVTITTDNIAFNSPDNCCWSNAANNNHVVTGSGQANAIQSGGLFSITPTNGSVQQLELNAGARLIPPLNVYLAFGGMYSTSSSENTGSTTTINNYVTNAASCPTAYISTPIFALATTATVYLCYQYVTTPTQSLYQFGGIFSNITTNSLTGATSCSSGYTTVQALVSNGQSNGNLYYCIRPWTSSDEVVNFGGFFSIGSQTWSSTVLPVRYDNLLSGTQACSSSGYYTQTFDDGFPTSFAVCVSSSSVGAAASSGAVIGSISSSSVSDVFSRLSSSLSSSPSFSSSITISSSFSSSSSSSLSSLVYLAFGGMFGFGSLPTDNGAYRYFNNNITNDVSCPLSYVQAAIYNETGVFPAWLCYKIQSQSIIPDYTFGGVYSSSVVNPYTTNYNCSDGFISSQFQGYPNYRYPMWYCYRPYISGDRIDNFGGFYSPEAPNQLSNVESCPIGYQTFDTFVDIFGYGQDVPLNYCLQL